MTGERYVSEITDADKKEDIILKEYLAGLKLQDGDEEELLIPDEDPPAGFDFTYNRCCRRTLYPDGDFSIVLSKEMVYRSDGKDQDNAAETVRMLHKAVCFLSLLSILKIGGKLVIFIAVVLEVIILVLSLCLLFSFVFSLLFSSDMFLFDIQKLVRKYKLLLSRYIYKRTGMSFSLP